MILTCLVLTACSSDINSQNNVTLNKTENKAIGGYALPEGNTVGVEYPVDGETTGREIDSPPRAIIEVNNDNVVISSGNYQWERKESYNNEDIGVAVIACGAAPIEIAEKMEPIKVPKATKATVKFIDDSQPQINAYLWEENKRGNELSLNNNQITLPTETGRHIIEILAKWPNGEASYTLVIEI